MTFFQTLKGSKLRSQWWNNTEYDLIQAFIVVLVTSKTEKDPIDNEGSRVLIRFPHSKDFNF